MVQTNLTKITLTFVVLLLATLACSIGASHLEKAREAAAEGDTAKAIEEYQLVLDDDDAPPPDKFAALIERGEIYQNQESYETALTDYAAALSVNNEDGTPAGDATGVYNKRVQIYLSQKAWDEIVADLDKVLAIQPDNYEALARRGYAHLQLRNFEQAIADLKASLQGNVTSASDDLDSKTNLINAYYDLAQAMLDLGEYEDAVQYHTEALALTDDKDHRAEILIARGFAYSEMDDHDNALVDLDEAIALDPNLALAYAYRSYVYGDQGRYETAIADAGKAVELGTDLSDSRRASIIHARALAYLFIDQYEAAVTDATEAINLAGQDNPDAARTYNIRSQAYRWMGEYKKAIADASRAIELGTTDVTGLNGFYRSRAWAYYYNDDDNDKALEDIEAAMSLNTNDPNGYDFDLAGRISYETGDYNGAVNNYQQALALAPDDHWIHNRLGDAHYALEDWGSAETEYLAAIRLEDQEPLFYENLGFILSTSGRYDEAIDALLEAINLDTSNAWVYNELGDIFYELDDMETAETSFRGAIEMNNSQPLFHENLGLVLRLTDRYKEAIASYSDALALDENRPYSYLGRGIAYYNLNQTAEAATDLETVLLFEVNDEITEFVQTTLAEIQ